MILAITFLFCIFLGRFLYIQLIWEEELHYRALDQWTREIPVNAGRGAILDASGELLAGNRAAYAVYARASAVEDAEGAADLLAGFLGDRETLLRKLTDRSKSEIVLCRRTAKEVVEALAEHEVKGVYYARNDERVYPYGALASQVIGFTAYDGTGTTGLEGYYDNLLAGKKGEILFETDLVGVDLKGAAAAYLPATDGLNLRLTLDVRIQSLAERVMGRVLGETSAKAVRAIVLDPRDASVLAMVNLPSYDLNEIPRSDLTLLNSLSRNRAVSDVYEPGSTFKIITAAADIEEYLRGNKRALDPMRHVFPSARTRTVDGTTIRCWSDHKNGKHANETLAEALNNSCNPCFVDIALALGKETFYDYLAAFRFGRGTGVDFSGESIGMLLPESSLRDCDFARIGFGQSIAVTPLQLACAAASAVNGGKYYAPRLAAGVFSDDGVKEEFAPVLLGRTVSEEASRILASMLEGVVRDGSGKKAYIEGYRVAGKTGTAQKYEDGVIAQGKYVSSFVGFFPADAPRYLALIIVDEPQGSYYGSTVAAPCAKEIFEGIIDIMKIPKEDTK